MIATDRKAPIRLARTDDLTQEQWSALRWETGIGSSDASAVLGYNPYRSALQAYNDFVGLTKKFEGNEATEWGTLLEDDVIEVYERRTGNRCERIRAVLQHPEHKFMIANVDRRVVGSEPKRLVEAKTAGTFAFMFGDWGDTNTDSVPDQYLCQIQHLHAVSFYQVTDLPLLVGGQKLYIYPGIERDETFIEAMIRIEQHFWHRVLLGRQALDEIAQERGFALADLRTQYIDATIAEEIRKQINSALDPMRPAAGSFDEASQRWIKDVERKTINATKEVAEAVAVAQEQMRIKKAAEKAIKAAKLVIGNYMQEFDELIVDDATAVTWRVQHKDPYWVKGSSSRVMRLKGE